jgi:hypothetical protein
MSLAEGEARGAVGEAKEGVGVEAKGKGGEGVDAVDYRSNRQKLASCCTVRCLMTHLQKKETMRLRR